MRLRRTLLGAFIERGSQALPLALSVLLFGVSPISFGQEKAGYSTRVVRDGVAIDVSIAPQEKDRSVGEFLEGDRVIISLKVSDTATGTPLTGANPAAWLDRASIKTQTDQRKCVSKVQGFLGGSILARADLDLNVYYVLALNNDATITVVDPLFGFGGTKLLAMVALRSPGEDWALTSDQNRLFVSMPDSNRIAVIDTVLWKLVSEIQIGPRPTRLALQPDEAYLWTSYDESAGATQSGVTVINTRTLAIAARIPTGRGRHEIAFSDDSRFAFVTNRNEGTTSIIDVRSLKKVRDVASGAGPCSIAFSKLAQAAFVVSEVDGAITSISGGADKVRRSSADPGLSLVRLDRAGRYGVIVNTSKNLVHVLDVSQTRIIQTSRVEKSPDQVAFSRNLVYIRHRDSEDVLTIPLDKIGQAGQSLPIADFPGGQYPFGKGMRSSRADGIIQAPDEDSVLVANPADKAIYYYKEGMAAPMGSFNNYGREPRAVMLVDRSLRETSPGLYQTVSRLGSEGNYDFALFLDRPRITHCSEFKIAPNPELARRHTARVQVQPMSNAGLEVGKKAQLAFKLVNTETRQPVTNLQDVIVLIFAPGVWQGRLAARHVAEGIYVVEFAPPSPAHYGIHLASASAGLTYSEVLSVDLRAGQQQPTR